jgi:hypothetical protein
LFILKIKISPIQRFGDTSDEIIGIIGIPAICEYTLRPVDIYIYCLPRFLPA